MIKVYDCECQSCGNIEEKFSKDNGVTFDSNCSNCDGEMQRVFTTFNFRLVYRNDRHVCSWGDQGYSSSQYWNQIKELRSQGYDVKSASCKY